ncbi:MAG: hypothetical protein KDD12_26180, partial [Lewinella sp.]|nr:hypothetical protein [Lewinella sp.]
MSATARGNDRCGCGQEVRPHDYPLTDRTLTNVKMMPKRMAPPNKMKLIFLFLLKAALYSGSFFKRNGMEINDTSASG